MSAVFRLNSPMLGFSVPALHRFVLPSAGAMQAYTTVQEASEALYEAVKRVAPEYS